MSDEEQVRTLFHDYARGAPTPDFDSDLWDQGRARRSKGRLAGVGLVVVATALAVLAYAALDSNIGPHPMPAGPPSPTPSTSERPIRGLEFPMLPDGVRPSTPVAGEAVLLFRSWPRGYPVELAVYPDGRVIWHPNQNDAGYFQVRLTPAGVARIRSMVIATGLFDHDVNLKRPGVYSRLAILRGDRWVYDAWGNASWFTGRTESRFATDPEARDLDNLERLLGDPSAWSFSSDLYADPEIKPFVMSTFDLGFDRGDPNLSKLPSPVRRLLARHLPTQCNNALTYEVARKIVHALARAGFAPLTNTPTYLDFKLPGFSGEPSNLHLRPTLPGTCGPGSPPG